MGVTEIARLPTFSTLALLLSHLNSNYSTSNSSKWSLTITSYRTLPFSTSLNSIPSSNHKPRILWTISDSSYPGIIFIFIEDTSKPDRIAFSTRNQNRASINENRVEENAKSGINQEEKEEIPNLSHPRFQSHVLSSSFLPLLLRTNLPAPLGAPSAGAGEKTNQPINGPGAWVQRGSPVTIEGSEMFVGELDQRFNPSSDPRIEGGGREVKVRIGGVSSGVGTGRNFGSVFEVEYLPLKRLATFSPFLPSLLYSFLPITLLNPLLQSQQSANQNQNQNPSVANDPRNQNQNQATPIILSSSVIQRETLAEAIPSLSERNGKEEDPDEAFTASEDPEEGWVGLEKGRRSSLMLLLMLKGEGVL